MKKIFTLAMAVIAAMSINANAALYLLGEVGETQAWGFDVGMPFTEVENNVYQIQVSTIRGWFGITQVLGTSWDETNAARLFPDGGSNITLGADNSATVNISDEKSEGDAWTLGAATGEMTITVDLNEYTMTLKAAKAVEVDKNIYVVGDLSGWEFNPDYMMKETSTGVYEISNVAIKGGFKLANPGWGVYNFGAPDEENSVITLGEVFNLSDNDPKNMTIGSDATAEYNVNIKLDITNAEAPTVLVTAADGGVQGIVVDADAPAVYYNLQGVQVANPANGLYIVRQGNKASKVYVK